MSFCKKKKPMAPGRIIKVVSERVSGSRLLKVGFHQAADFAAKGLLPILENASTNAHPARS